MSIHIDGYSISEELFIGKNSDIYRGKRNNDEASVVIKHLNKEFPTPEELSRFGHEHQIMCKLKGEKVSRTYGLEKHYNSLVMINEDIGGESLSKYLANHKPDLGEKINLAIHITEALGQIHRHHVIHKDINPSNIIVNRESNDIRIIDFGISTELSLENQETLHPNILEGTLAYISPEQTGRMNTPMDYRTDLYSLGVTFYELFTGALPFQAEDAMGLVHCHIAIRPKEPHNIKSEIPESLSAIIMKLLAKAPEERYQSIQGLKKDLEFCLDIIKSGQTPINFSPGRNDISGLFQIPNKLYGREQDLDILLSAFDQVTHGGKKIMLVSGYSGVGKSSLIHEINKPVTARRGNFISGKFDQFRRNIPYSALIQAFQQLVKNLLAEDEKRLTTWRKKLLAALGPSGKIVIDVIPEVVLIIGSQPDVQELDPDQARNRFNIVFQNFIRVFADSDHPLCLFIDDLQWADLPSLQLIEQFMLDDETNHLLIIGAYRDNETDPTHPLMRTVDNLNQHDVTVHAIHLKPLEMDHVNQLISDLIGAKSHVSAPLASLCHEKTNGNPFFLNQLLTSLYENAHIKFDHDKGTWAYDIDEIREQDISDNVVDLMVEKIMKLSKETREIITKAACISNTFDLAILSMVSAVKRTDAARLLSEALEERLILPNDSNYKFVSGNHESLNAGYRFIHDRVLQAAYSLTPEAERNKIHLQTGRLLLKNTQTKDLSEKIFDIVNHLNHGVELISERNETVHLAQLNFMAGQKAKLSAAYIPSFEYFLTGIRLIGLEGWTRNYGMMLSLHTEAMESAYLCANIAEVDRLYGIIVDHAKTVLDRSKAGDIKILSLVSESRFSEALETGLDLLRHFKVVFPKNPNKLSIILELLKIKFMLRKFTDDDILGLQPITDRSVLAQLSILHKLASTALFSKPDLYPLTVFKRVFLSLKFGKEPLYSISSFSSFGLIHCSIGLIRDGVRYGNLAEKLLNKAVEKKEKTRVMVLVNGFIRHWNAPIRDTIAPLLEAYESRIETGDIEYASHAISMYSMHILFAGISLKDVESEQAKYVKAIRLFKQKHDVDTVSMFHQNTLNLMDADKPLTEFSGENFNEKEMVSNLYKEGNYAVLVGYHSSKLYSNYLADDYNEAFHQIQSVTPLLTSVRGMLVVSIINFYESLTRIALCRSLPEKDIKNHLKKVVKNQKQLNKWATYAPMNFRHKWHLVEAEKHALHHHDEKARYHYKLAVNGARENEYIQDEALSYERYALFLLNRNEEDVAGFYIKKARHAYAVWGAMAKAVHIEKTCPHLVEKRVNQPRVRTTERIDLSTSGKATQTTSAEVLDMTSLLKASQMISREIILSRLIEKLMTITMENLGAEKCFVILEQNGTFFIEGESWAGQEEMKVLESIPLDSHSGLSQAIVNYVVRTRRVLILDDAAHEGDFMDDSYVIKNTPKSILCNAICNQDKITAVIYAENNLTKGAFRIERLGLLEALAGQAAISITNARLYENLEEKVAERTAELNRTLQDVKEANEKIMSSIRYSGLIQNSLLPDPAMVSSILPESFFIWKPRDIIGGDIYVCERLDKGTIVAVIDCTGHGVPGALMTMLASSNLRRIIREERIHSPAEILKRLNFLIKSSLQQDTEHALSDDGMDAAICYYDEQESIVYFSGAKMPLYYVSQGEITVVKGDKKSIGYVASDLAYEFKTNRIENKDHSKIFYMVTDGYTDQPGGDEDKRFGNKRLKGLILENHHLPFERQKDQFLIEFEKHRGDKNRVDDVTFTGFKFK